MPEFTVSVPRGQHSIAYKKLKVCEAFLESKVHVCIKNKVYSENVPVDWKGLERTSKGTEEWRKKDRKVRVYYFLSQRCETVVYNNA